MPTLPQERLAQVITAIGDGVLTPAINTALSGTGVKAVVGWKWPEEDALKRVRTGGPALIAIVSIEPSGSVPRRRRAPA